MALVLPDRVLETSSTTGTGTYTLAGAVTGFQSFSAVGDANTCQYVAYDVDGNGNPSGGWEVGLGTYTASGTTLARTTIYASSNSGSAVNWSAGTRRIAVTRAAAGTLVVRQPGGTAGTDEVQVYHDGASGYIKAKGGYLQFFAHNQSAGFAYGDTTTLVVPSRLDSTTLTYLAYVYVTNMLGFNSSFGTNPDAVLYRKAAKVIGLASVFDGTGNGTLAPNPLTPSQITSNQNNYAPGVAWIYRLSTDASRDITGLSISQVDGQMVRVCNVGSNSIVLKHQDTNSTAANRFLCKGAADITLAADEEAEGWYDSTTSRWRIAKV